MIPEMLEKFRPSFPERLYHGAIIALLASVVIAPGIIWAGLRITYIPFLNGMATQGKAGAQSLAPELPGGVVMIRPTTGTVARRTMIYPFLGQPEVAAEKLINPLPHTAENLRRGQWEYDIYCQPCHGYKGLGDGEATGPGRLPAANNLSAQKVRDLKDGAIYHIISAGQNTMPSYARQVAPLDRWDVVNYVRVLQRSLAPRPEDLPSTDTATTSASATSSATEVSTDALDSSGSIQQ